jgi:transposase
MRGCSRPGGSSQRVWAIEGCNGVGRHIAHRLVASGETVKDVPAKLSAQVRVFGTGNGRKTDPVDAHDRQYLRVGGSGISRRT